MVLPKTQQVTTGVHFPLINKFTRLLPPPKGSGFPPIRIASNFYENSKNLQKEDLYKSSFFVAIEPATTYALTQRNDSRKGILFYLFYFN